MAMLLTPPGIKPKHFYKYCTALESSTQRLKHSQYLHYNFNRFFLKVFNLMKLTLDAIQLMGGRLCHDLAAPIGALSLGLEMLAEQKLTKDQLDIVLLIEQSLDSTKKRLELFRYLLGYGQTEDKPLMSEILTFLDQYLQNSRLTLRTEGISHLQGTVARFAMALIITASESLPRGGELSVQLNGQTFSVLLTGVGAEISPEVTKILTGQSTIATPRSLWAWYTHCLGVRLKLHIEVRQVPLEIICTQAASENKWLGR
jgi:histidine phosphotransferase ChpT